MVDTEVFDCDVGIIVLDEPLEEKILDRSVPESILDWSKEVLPYAEDCCVE